LRRRKIYKLGSISKIMENYVDLKFGALAQLAWADSIPSM